MNIVKVDATVSTNSLARQINGENTNHNFCVSAEYQTGGRGQMNNNWNSQKSQNLTFTLVYNHLDLKIQNQFMLNALVCLKIFKVLKQYDIPDVFLKWPNDILADHKKICGILIENTLRSNMIKTSYAGIGLNVNQVNFDNLPQATSLKTITGKNFQRDELLYSLVEELKDIPVQLHKLSLQSVLNDYKSKLYRFNQTSEFSLNGNPTKGTIKNILADGKLIVSFGQDNNVQSFQYKGIKQLL